MDGNAFVPATITVARGSVVRWTNLDNAQHNAVMLDGSCGTATLDKGQTGALRFNLAGTYQYYCTIHPNMRGTLVVTG